ncbi:MAG TPA: SigB/SigF/SigG family RNA polymerase sigma factor [Syntrophomonadaceae bacterium]|nr:SigB/SigF/SigG family RNA polymerase sigma factor [Syntrophomonadaceae bacterium]HNX29179.1 SigB/SigF/SigG family RNA polymerase sigma factor [Syntrophomonadaceae bacterium]HPR92547.1 SigB/SigF/SigG family RNA polymerase sigma factor [Syntrophomonadaceae bacterium]
MTSLNSYEHNNELILKAQQGDKGAREQVYETNVGLVYMVMERFKNSAYDYEDLFQVGSIGLLKAIDKFDFSYNVRFSTYAVPMIIGEIKKFLRDDGLVKVQRGMKEISSKVSWAQEKLRGELGQEPNISQIAELLNISKEEIVIALEACQKPAYIHDVVPGEEKEHLSLIDKLGKDDNNINLLEKLALREAMAKLDEREREVVLRRFFKDETQTAIAGDMCISQVQISRIEKGALKKLKKILE